MMIPTEITFEYDGAEHGYTHEQVLDVSELLEEQDVSMDALMGQFEATRSQMKAAIEQQFRQLGYAGAEVSLGHEKVDETTLRGTSSIKWPPDAPEGEALKGAVMGEVSQLLIMLGQADPEAREEAEEFLFAVLQKNDPED